jgi:hypothetical protein
MVISSCFKNELRRLDINRTKYQLSRSADSSLVLIFSVAGVFTELFCLARAISSNTLLILLV